MKASEVRIGNIFAAQSERYKILTVIRLPGGYYIDGECKDGLEHRIKEDAALPVSLTEQWLEDFGFKEIGTIISKRFSIKIDEFENDEIWLIIGWHKAEEENKHATVYCEYSEHEISLRPIEYVHQLQNLYQSITNEELKRKE